MEQGDDELEMNEVLEELDHEDFELNMMKDRFAKLLLGEDMSGSGKGVCTAVTISNAITNLYATVFGQNLRLEPLSKEKKAMWRREMDCFLSVCDFMVEFASSPEPLQDGTTIEVLMHKPRSDIYLNLPALQKLEAMLIEILDGFGDREFGYVEKGSLSSKSGITSLESCKNEDQRKKENKWWAPVPVVPPGGLLEDSRKNLRHSRDCANQIQKAVMAINNDVLSEMDIPDTYLVNLPKSARASIGDSIYKQMYYPEKFSPENLLDSLNIKSEHEALELADRVEEAMYTWKRKACVAHSKSSWDLMKDLVDTDRNDKNQTLAHRAESLLFCLKQRFPELSQTSLDICKIQYNQDVGKAILESYSRVLEGLAYNIVSWIEDVFAADQTERSDQ